MDHVAVTSCLALAHHLGGVAVLIAWMAWRWLEGQQLPGDVMAVGDGAPRTGG